MGAAPIPGLNPAQFLQTVPEEFWPLVHTFTAEQLHGLYPAAHNHRLEGIQSETISNTKREYLEPVVFLRRYSAYKFAFILEYDVRCIGKSWGSFWNRALKIAVQNVADQELGSLEDEVSSPDMFLQEHHLILPDLILFSDAINVPLKLEEKDNESRQSPQWRFGDVVYKEFTSVYGMSQKMVYDIHRHSLEGSAGFIEEFIPTLAAHESDIQVAVVPLGTWNDVSVLHCCSDVSTRIYDEWYQSETCHAFTILHPVKNANESVWGS